MQEPIVPEIPVSIVYLGPDGSEDLDSQFHAICAAVPRVGEHYWPEAGKLKVVHRVYHRPVRIDELSRDKPYLAITVVLTEWGANSSSESSSDVVPRQGDG